MTLHKTGLGNADCHYEGRSKDGQFQGILNYRKQSTVTQWLHSCIGLSTNLC